MITLVVIVQSSPVAQALHKEALAQGVALETFSGVSGLHYPPGIRATLEESPSFTQARKPGEAPVVLSNGQRVKVPEQFLFNLKTGKPFTSAPFPSPA